ncbi:unnamed protein product [Clonostachys byssicola]|uniref:Uncharacterized protein n=1 Tax=Clonostachys byssicola TaxID=160290 RepID=A0A9N9UWS1_9HYPO|nr:unnamed protein product [Clonostachys byssicola]
MFDQLMHSTCDVLRLPLRQDYMCMDRFQIKDVINALLQCYDVHKISNTVLDIKTNSIYSLLGANDKQRPPAPEIDSCTGGTTEKGGRVATTLANEPGERGTLC